MSDSLQLRGLWHARLPWPSLSPGVCSNSCPVSWWCHPIISSCRSLLFLPSIFPSIRVFSNELSLHIKWPKYWSFNFSISPSYDYSGSIFFRINLFNLAVQGLSRVFFSTTFQKHQLFGPQLSYGPILTSIHDYWKNHNSDYMDLCWQSDVSSLLFNMLSRLVIAFLPRSKHLLIS